MTKAAVVDAEYSVAPPRKQIRYEGEKSFSPWGSALYFVLVYGLIMAYFALNREGALFVMGLAAFVPAAVVYSIWRAGIFK
jgi:hypothetical protein